MKTTKPGICVVQLTLFSAYSKNDRVVSYFIWVKTIFGSNLVTKNAQIQLKVKAMEVPKDLNSGENSSTFIVQAKGPIPIRKKIIQLRVL